MENKSKEKMSLKIEGMTCATCSNRVEKALGKVNGVFSANVNLANETASVFYNPSVTGLQDFIVSVEKAGYKVIKENKQEEDINLINALKSKRRLYLAWVLTIPLMILMLIHMIFGLHINYYVHFSVVFTAIVLFVPGFPTVSKAIMQIFRFSANMDVLITLGTLASFITGVLNIAGLKISSYAEIGAMIMSIHLTGRYIENRAKGKASRAIHKLLELAVKKANVLRNNKEIEINAEELTIGDIILIRPGEKIPADGEIIEGKTEIDESIATGESVPVFKTEGDEVIGATINGSGFIKVKATKLGENSFIAQVAKLVAECQSSKVPVQEFADKVVGYFVPVVLIISVLTFSIWIIFPGVLKSITNLASGFLPYLSVLDNISLAIFACIAVLVIACPCALGLATPTALIVGSSKGAENGILFRNGKSIQLLKDIKVVALDKTGTITEGKPFVKEVIPVNGITKEELLSLCASIESKSEHPIAKSIVSYAKTNNIEMFETSEFTSLAGMGIVAKKSEAQIIAGNLALMQKYSVDTSELSEQIFKLEKTGGTIIYMGKNNKLAGIILLADIIKKDSIDAIQNLKKAGIKTVMLTGDNRYCAQMISAEAGVDNYIPEILPQDKVNEIKKLQKEYGIVAMIGDGINDAPALARADVGIAIGTGTDIAIESADITIVQGKLSQAVKAYHLSGLIFKKIKQNLFWAFFYNLFAIPFAMLGLLHPIIAEAAMAFSSINVIMNSLRIKKQYEFKITDERIKN